MGVISGEAHCPAVLHLHPAALVPKQGGVAETSGQENISYILYNPQTYEKGYQFRYTSNVTVL